MPVTVDGHHIGTRQNPSGRWVAVCSCGYSSSSSITESWAAGSAIHHVRKVLADRRRNGLPLGIHHTVTP